MENIFLGFIAQKKYFHYIRSSSDLSTDSMTIFFIIFHYQFLSKIFFAFRRLCQQEAGLFSTIVPALAKS